MFRSAVGGALIVAIMASVFDAREAAAGFNVNLVANGDAESGTLVGVNGGFDIYSTPGWTNARGAFEAESYSQGAGGNIGPSSPGPADRGKLLFYGGNAALTVADQSISVSDVASSIDAGRVVADVSGWLGGFSTQDDDATFTATYLDGTGKVLGSTVIGPVTAADRGDVSGLLYRSASEFVPIGTRSIEATLTLTRYEGTFNNGAADDLSILLVSVPEPSSLLMCGIPLAFGLLGGKYLRRALH